MSILCCVLTEASSRLGLAGSAAKSGDLAGKTEQDRYMRTIRQCIAFALIVLLALPAWSDSNAVGSVVNGSSATLRNEPLASGSTVFSGDVVSVGNDGSAEIAVTGGARITVSKDGTIRLTRNQKFVDLSVERGTATFSGEPKDALEVVFGGATIRPLQGHRTQGETLGIIKIESPDSADIVAQKGSLQIVTGHSAGATTVEEGHGVRITPGSALPTGASDAAKPSNAAPPKNLTAIQKSVIITTLAGAAVAAIVLSVEEPKRSDPELQNEVSPFHLNSK